MQDNQGLQNYFDVTNVIGFIMQFANDNVERR